MSITLDPAIGSIISIPLIIPKAITSATTSASVAKARVPCKGRIVGFTPLYGSSGGSTPFTDLDLDVENGTTDIFAGHAVIDSSADTTTEPTVTGSRVVADGDILHLDAVTTGGSTPSLVGYGYMVHIARE